MTLFTKQIVFSRLLARFITELAAKGYDVTGGEWFRPQAMAQLYAAEKKGISNSLHCKRLACDLNLFKGPKYLVTVLELEEAGKLWESYSGPDYKCTWGGRFEVEPDADHFSIEDEGVR